MDAALATAARICTLQREARERYQEIERLVETLLPAHAPAAGERSGPPIPLGEAVVFRIVDPFIDARTGEPCKHWKHQPISRYDFEVTPL